MSTQADITLAAFNVNQTLTVTLPSQINALLNAIADQNSINAEKKLNMNILEQINAIAWQIKAYAGALGTIAGSSAV